jgi:hypothetical protein
MVEYKPRSGANLLRLALRHRRPEELLEPIILQDIKIPEVNILVLNYISLDTAGKALVYRERAHQNGKSVAS